MISGKTIWWCLILILSVSCNRKKKLFSEIPASASGIRFANNVLENDTCNVLEYMNIYTGAGVAAGDVNNDGLPDLFFSGNQESGRLYINKGDFKFEDVTEKAGLLSNRWQTGVSMVDINQDGWLDIYVNVSGSEKFGSLSNLLYINNKNGTFSEKAEAYGIADKRLTMNASFFDYDRDGDLDLFLITNPADEMVSGINSLNERKINGESAGTDILYRNNGNETFTDVSKEAGILVEGYSLGAAITDVNEDGWPDIYVSNDFLTNDILYINQRDGRFRDETSNCLKHTSFASMGNDAADFNNDGHTDLFVLDMLPEDNYRKKMIIPPASFDKFQLSLAKGYEPQYTRNTLQLNNGNGTFSDIGFMAGVSSTDWSWSALLADYDNDGDKDLMVTNGFYRDLGNLDYIHYQARLQNPMGKQTAKREEKLRAIQALPKIPLNDYLFENNGNLSFTKRSNDWGFEEPGFSNGACYADLDNDGDLDLVINQFNSTAKLYRNNSESINKSHYLKVAFNAPLPNRQGIGAKLTVFTGDSIQVLELNPYRGFESSMEPILHVGLRDRSSVDSLQIRWPDGNVQTIGRTAADQLLTITYRREPAQKNKAAGFAVTSNLNDQPLVNVADELGILYQHTENEFVDFKLQPLLPHMHSANGPGIAVGDIDGDGLDDFVVGAAMGSAAAIFRQSNDGRFKKMALPDTALSDEMGVLLFDADGDQDQDLYIVGGGSEHSTGKPALQDKLYVNTGSGKFILAPLPDTKGSGSCVTAADYDRDGDLDLFVGSRVDPGRYPSSSGSYLLRNESKSADKPVFVPFAAPFLSVLGMVTSAVWTDFDNDGWIDLVVAGEFMPLTFVKNDHGTLKDVTAASGVSAFTGWWNNVIAADFDHDGDMDLVAGNLGLNTRHQASADQPLCIYGKDFDKNGLIDPVMCYYVDGVNYIYPSRDEMIRQVNPMRRRFPTYESFASVSFDESFTKEELKDALVVKATCFESSYFENLGGGKFKRHPLPRVAQVAPVFGIVAVDVNDDGYSDLVLSGNSYATEASTGRYDAMQGVVLMNDRKGSFVESRNMRGFTGGSDSKGSALAYSHDGGRLLMVANNNDSLQVFRLGKPAKLIRLRPADQYALITPASGATYKTEFRYGSNYLSSSSRMFEVPAGVKTVQIIDSKGSKRNEVVQ